MITFIGIEIRKLFSPLYFTIFAIISLVTWRICLPPFQYKVIYHSSEIAYFYEFVISTAGLFSYFLLQLSHFTRGNDNSLREILAVRISGKTFFWGLYITYYIFFMIAFVLPANIAAFIQQMIYAPDNIDISVYLLGVFGHLFSFFHLIIFIMLIMSAKINNELLTLFLFFVFYILLLLISGITGISIFNARLMIQELNHGIISFSNMIYILLWCVSCIFIVMAGNHFSKNILIRRAPTPCRTNLLSRLADKCQVHIMAHHITMMGLIQQRMLAIILLAGLIIIMIVNRLLQNQLAVSIDLYLMVVMPIVFACNQSFILKIDDNAGMKDSILLKSKSYIAIILNRWLVLILLQIIIQLAGIVMVLFYSNSMPVNYIINIILTGILISLVNLCVNVFTRANGFANIFLILLIYVQLNEETRLLAAKYQYLQIFSQIWLEPDAIGISLCLLTGIKVIVLLLITSILIHFMKYGQIRLLP